MASAPAGAAARDGGAASAPTAAAVEQDEAILGPFLPRQVRESDEGTASKELGLQVLSMLVGAIDHTQAGASRAFPAAPRPARAAAAAQGAPFAVK